MWCSFTNKVLFWVRVAWLSANLLPRSRKSPRVARALVCGRVLRGARGRSRGRRGSTGSDEWLVFPKLPLSFTHTCYDPPCPPPVHDELCVGHLLERAQSVHLEEAALLLGGRRPCTRLSPCLLRLLLTDGHLGRGLGRRLRKQTGGRGLDSAVTSFVPVAHTSV